MNTGNKNILLEILHRFIMVAILFFGFITIVASGGGGGGGGDEAVDETPSVEDQVSDTVSPDDNNNDVNIPLAPTNVEAIPSNSKIEITWEASPGSTGYNLYYSELPGVNKLNGNKIENVQSPYTHSPVLNGTTIYYTITAYNDDGESSESIEASAQPFNTEPTALFISPVAVPIAQQFQVDASSSFDVDGSIVSYKFDFGDGSPIISQPEPVCYHTYQDDDHYLITLTVEDNDGDVNTITSYIACGGLSMSSPGNISNTLGIYSQMPEIYIDELGNVYVMWQERGCEVRLSTSHDQGMSFSSPQIIHPWDGNTVQSFKITNNGDYIHTAWTYLQTNGDTEILYSRSTDRGQSFESPAFLSVVDGINSHIGGVVSDGNSYLGVVMNDSEPGTTIDNISFTFSEDNGETFEYPTIISEFGDACDIAISDEYVYIIWLEDYWELRGVYLSRSDDFGRTFSDPVNLCPDCMDLWQLKPFVNNKGDFYIMYSVRHTSDLQSIQSIKVVKSEDHGLSFDNFLTVPDINSSSIEVLIDEDENIYLCWSEHDGPRTDDPIRGYFMYSADKEVTFSDPILLPFIFGEFRYSLSRPRMAKLTNNKIMFVWHERDSLDDLPEIYWSIGNNPIQ